MGWIFLIGAVVIFFTAFALEFLFYSTTKKEGQEQSVSRTYAPIGRTVASLIITIVFCTAFIAGALAFIFSDQALEIAFWLGYTFGGLFCISIPFSLFLICTHDYEIITEDAISVNRFFKKKEINFSDISHFTYSLNQLTVYGNDNSILFFVGDMRIGLNDIVKSLEVHGIAKK